MELIFPGMDPYLESSGFWPGFHDAFLSYAREALQPLLPAGYYAELNTREEIGIAGLRADKILYPDLAVKEAGEARPRESPRQGPAGAATTLPEHLVVLEQEPLEVSFLEIREVHGDRVVTLIELLSPSNKLPGPDREAYERKVQDTLKTGTSWVEIDLLRAGKRLGFHPGVEAHCQKRGHQYLVVVSRGSQRSPRLDLELYGFTVRDAFPVVAIPLLDPDPDVPLDLGRVFRRAYETGPYAKVLRYGTPLDPPLTAGDSSWAEGVLRARSQQG